jgi:hypothetical protein
VLEWVRSECRAWLDSEGLRGSADIHLGISTIPLHDVPWSLFSSRKTQNERSHPRALVPKAQARCLRRKNLPIIFRRGEANESASVQVRSEILKGSKEMTTTRVFHQYDPYNTNPVSWMRGIQLPADTCTTPMILTWRCVIPWGPIPHLGSAPLPFAMQC